MELKNAKQTGKLINMGTETKGLGYVSDKEKRADTNGK
jgi:hypothetical protein